MKPRNPPLQSARLPDQVRERIRDLDYSLSTGKTCLYWLRFFVRWHGLKHPRDMGAPQVGAFLSMLANRCLHRPIRPAGAGKDRMQF